LVDNSPEDSRVVTEEAFGPILPLLRYSDLDEVIERANNSEYGLDGELAQAAVSSLKIKCTECVQKITKLFMLLSGRGGMAFPDSNLTD
jgi:hypothetical protein